MCIDVDDHAVLVMLKAQSLDVRSIVIEFHCDLHVMPTTQSQSCLDCGCPGRSMSPRSGNILMPAQHGVNQMLAKRYSHLIVICADQAVV